MRSANDPSVDYKDLVRTGYDGCGIAYEDARGRECEEELRILIAELDPGAGVLDIGCGSGVPITRELASRFDVIGVDISGEQIRRARENVPGARFMHADIMSVDFADAGFDAVVAFYAMFHLPREEHAALLARISRWLRPGGIAVLTVNRTEEEPYTEGDFFGHTMFWSYFGLDTYRSMVEANGLEVLNSVEIGHGYGESYTGDEERHPMLTVRKR